MNAGTTETEAEEMIVKEAVEALSEIEMVRGHAGLNPAGSSARMTEGLIDW